MRLAARDLLESDLEVHVVRALQSEKARFGCLKDFLRLILSKLTILIISPYKAEGVQGLGSTLRIGELLVLADGTAPRRLPFFLLLL